MAWTNTITNDVQGASRVVFIDMTSDSATQEYQTGFTKIRAITVGIVSANTGGTTFTPNKLSAATDSNGMLSVTGSTSGDRFIVKAEGY